MLKKDSKYFHKKFGNFFKLFTNLYDTIKVVKVSKLINEINLQI